MKSFSNNFLIAMPGLDDENFSESVTLICHHDSDGAMGIIVNQPLQLNLQELFIDGDIDIDKLRQPHNPIWHGGPLQPDHVFALHDASREWDSTLYIGENLRLTTSEDFLKALAAGEHIDNYLLALGYAGWETSQLEQEMANNSWVYATADSALLFNTPVEKRWQAAASIAGIDFSKMSYYSGKA